MSNHSAHSGQQMPSPHNSQLIKSMTYELIPLSTLDAAIEALPAASSVSVTCSPVKGLGATIESTDKIRSLGHDAIPHLSARLAESRTHVADIAKWLRQEGISKAFIVGGDADTPAGPYPDALSFMRDLLDSDPGLTQLGVTAYPDSHPLIDAKILHEALHAKQQLLSEAGVDGWASTQMCFDARQITKWLGRERDLGLNLPIHLGIAGVVDAKKLVTMGVRLGIGASLRYLRKNRAAVGRLLAPGAYDPGRLLDELGSTTQTQGISGIHCFTFNQVEATRRWQDEATSQ